MDGRKAGRTEDAKTTSLRLCQGIKILLPGTDSWPFIEQKQDLINANMVIHRVNITLDSNLYDNLKSLKGN